MADFLTVIPHQATVGVEPTDVLPDKDDFGFDRSPVGTPPESLDLDTNSGDPLEKDDFGFNSPMENDLVLPDEVLDEIRGMVLFSHHEFLAHIPLTTAYVLPKITGDKSPTCHRKSLPPHC